MTAVLMSSDVGVSTGSDKAVDIIALDTVTGSGMSDPANRTRGRSGSDPLGGIVPSVCEPAAGGGCNRLRPRGYSLPPPVAWG